MLAPHRVAKVIQSLGTPDFERSLFELIQERLSIKQISGFGLESGRDPICVLATGSNDEEIQMARELAIEYTGGAYNQDPVLNWIKRHPIQQDILCNNWAQLPDSAFRRRFYELPKIGYEAVVAARSDTRTLVLSVYREVDGEPFNPDEIEYLRFLTPVVVSGVWKQMDMLMNARNSVVAEMPMANELGAIESRAARLIQMREGLMAQSGALTQREADICAHIVLGYTTLAISMILGITVNTVATHRKRAYAKLGISSQTELFGRCLSKGILSDRGALTH